MLQSIRMQCAGWPRRFARLAMLAFVLSMSTGCAFMFLKSEDALPKDQALAIYGLSAKPLPESSKQALQALDVRTDWATKSATNMTIADTPQRVRIASDAGIEDLLLPGFWPQRVRYIRKIDNGGAGEEILSDGKAFLPGFPLLTLWTSAWEKSYWKTTGELCSGNQIHGVLFSGILGGYSAKFNPVADKTNPQEKLSSITRFRVRKGYYLLGGMFSFGQVNHRYYGQLFWIPIPLGRSK